MLFGYGGKDWWGEEEGEERNESLGMSWNIINCIDINQRRRFCFLSYFRLHKNIRTGDSLLIKECRSCAVSSQLITAHSAHKVGVYLIYVTGLEHSSQRINC